MMTHDGEKNCDLGEVTGKIFRWRGGLARANRGSTV